MKKIKAINKKIKLLASTFVTFMTTLLITCPVYASESEPVIITGTRQLLAAVIAIITGLVTAFITMQALKTGTQWINAPAEEKPKHWKNLLTTIIAGVVTLTIGSTITYIVGFYS